MFDLSTSKMFLVLLIALLVVGPKELPGLLRTVGRYVGMMKRQAAEFRAQFDDAMRESELADLKKQVEDFGKDARDAVQEAESTFTKEADALKAEATGAIEQVTSTVKGEAEGAVERTELPALDGASAVASSAVSPTADAALAAALEAASPTVAEPQVATSVAPPIPAPARVWPAPEKVGA